MRRRTRRHRLRLLIITVAAATATGFVVLFLGRSVSSPAATGPTDRAGVATTFASTPAVAVDAGSDVTLAIIASDGQPDGEAVAMVVSAAGAERIAARIDEGDGSLVIDAAHTRSAGVVTVILLHPDDPSRSQTAEFRVSPISGQHALDMNVGPTALGPDDTTMAVGLLTDALGNPVADGTPIQLTVTTADGQQRIVEIPSRSGLAVAELGGSELAPEFALAMSGAGSHSLVETVVVQPERPASFQLLSDGAEHRGDGRSRHIVTSTPLADEAGRAPADGTIAELVVDGPDGPTTIVGEVVDGRVTATLVAPDRPATVTIRARVAGATSDALEIEYLPAVLPFDVVFATDQGQRSLSIGPVLDPDGGVVPDGTVAEAGAVRLQLVRGRATLDLDAGVALPTITVLGIEGTIR